MKKVLRILLKRSVWAVISVFFAILFAILAVAKDAVVPHQKWIDNYFGVRRTFLVNDDKKDDAQAVDTNYYPTKYETYGENDERVVSELVKMQNDALDASKRVNDEGMVLLWNKDNALPLSKTDEKHVSTFGVHGLAYDNNGTWIDNWIYHGTGSANIDLRKNVGMVEENGLNIGPRLQLSLENRGIEYNQKLIDSTWKNLEDKSTPNGYEAVQTGAKRDRKEVSWQLLQGDTGNKPLTEMKNTYGDAAIYVIGRYEGEGKDVKDKLNLTAEEKTVLKGLSDARAAGDVKKVIVVLLLPNPMNMKEFEEYSIDACLWAGYGGNTATEAVCDVLWGDVNPSGKVVDTWAYDANSAPASVNYGDFKYADGSSIYNGAAEHNDAYVAYQEGIYVGYRYYETRYEDSVIGGRNAVSNKGTVAGNGNWNYSAEVKYPFGYGTGYTTFAYSGYSVAEKGDDYEISVTVTNLGNVAGKESVQIYLQKPYTEYDVNKGIEKAAVELVGYAKTGELKPHGREGDKQTLTITVPKYEFKTYDSYGEKTYILEKGDYYLAAGSNAHDAVNNILAAKGYTKANGMDADGNKALTHKITYGRDDFETYSVSYNSTSLGYEITNRFDDADINLYEGTKEQKIKYLSRNNWGETYPVTAVALTANRTIIDALKLNKDVENNAEDKMPKEGDANLDVEERVELKLIQLRGVPYGDPLWDDLVDQLTYDELIGLLKGSAMPIESIAAMEGSVYDGPCGCRDDYIDELGARCAFPCAPIVAATFNDELVEEMAVAFGEVIRQHERTGIWGVSSNIHRLPYNGRNWEYFAEDGFLSGKMTAAEAKGIMSKGVVVYNKHFALNNMEINRNGVNTWANEQTIREIYLKAFEAGVTEANGNGMMSAYNRIGCTYAGEHKGLLTDVLRNEWGFKGVVASDYPDREYMGKGQPKVIARAVIAGQDEWISDVVGNQLNTDEFKNNATLRIALRESAKRNLYVRVNSCVVNGMDSNTRVVTIMPEWQKAIHTAEISVGVIMGVCVLITAGCWVFRFFDRRKNDEN